MNAEESSNTNKISQNKEDRSRSSERYGRHDEDGTLKEIVVIDNSVNESDSATAECFKEKHPDDLYVTEEEHTLTAEANEDPAERNNRLLAAGGVTGIKDTLEPVIGYAAEPLLPLAEACAPLQDILFDLFYYVQMALDETPEEPPDGLSIDESAAIRLYTIEWEKPHRSLYSMLNYTLKTAPREELRPYFKYMKLFITALVKLPCVPPTTVWRGVTKDLSAEFPKGTKVTWWAFSSTTTELKVLENDMYLGTTGERTLFSVEAINGRTVRAHSHFVTEDEILLMPGTYMEVESQFSPAADLRIIHLKQLRPTQTLLELPYKGALLYPPLTTKLPWYKNKRTLLEIGLVVLACIAGIIVGAVLGSRKSPPPPICRPPNSSIRADYFWSFDCQDAREDLTGLYNGTLMNGPDFIEPDFSGQGSALQLNDGLMQYVELPRSLNLTLNMSFTVSAWLYLASYQSKTILSDCNDYNTICITLSMQTVTLDVQIFNWTSKEVIEKSTISVQSSICQACWVYVSFTFDCATGELILYFNGVEVQTTTFTFINMIWKDKIEKKLSYIGMDIMNNTLPYAGLIDQLNILYSVKDASEILREASLTYQYKLGTNDIHVDYGPNNILARSQSLYRLVTNNKSSILFNESQSYFQVNGTTLLDSLGYSFSIGFWVRLNIQPSNLSNPTTAIFQISSKIAAVSSESYRCTLGLQIFEETGQIVLLFPKLFNFFRAFNSKVENDTWTHIGISFTSPDEFSIYQDGILMRSLSNARYSSIVNENPRFSITFGGAYLDPSISVKPPNYEQMNCFATLRPFNYTKMYGEMANIVFYSRTLSEDEFYQLTEEPPY